MTSDTSAEVLHWTRVRPCATTQQEAGPVPVRMATQRQMWLPTNMSVKVGRRWRQIMFHTSYTKLNCANASNFYRSLLISMKWKMNLKIIAQILTTDLWLLLSLFMTVNSDTFFLYKHATMHEWRAIKLGRKNWMRNDCHDIMDITHSLFCLLWHNSVMLCAK